MKQMIIDLILFILYVILAFYVVIGPDDQLDIRLIVGFNMGLFVLLSIIGKDFKK